MSIVRTASGMSPVELLAWAVRGRYIQNRRRHEFVQKGRPSTWGSSASAMRRYDGGRGGEGQTFENLWLKIAAKLMAAGADMCCVLDAGFDETAGADPPSPQYFLSKQALENAAQYLPQAVAAVRIEFESASRQCRLAYTRYAATRPEHLVWRSVITDPGIEASPLFRFMLSRETNNMDLADKYRPAAEAQFLSRAYVYLEALPQLPRDFVAAATSKGGDS